MNKVVLIGRISKDVELTFIPGSGAATTTITVVTDRYNTKTKEKEAEFTNVVLWGKQAESTAQYMSKGSQVAISGRLQTRSYDAKDGTKRYITEVIADQFGGIQFLGGKKESNTNEYSTPVNDAFGGGDYKEEMQVDNSSDMPF